MQGDGGETEKSDSAKVECENGENRMSEKKSSSNVSKDMESVAAVVGLRKLVEQQNQFKSLAEDLKPLISAKAQLERQSQFEALAESLAPLTSVRAQLRRQNQFESLVEDLKPLNSAKAQLKWQNQFEALAENLKPMITARAQLEQQYLGNIATLQREIARSAISSNLASLASQIQMPASVMADFSTLGVSATVASGDIYQHQTPSPTTQPKTIDVDETPKEAEISLYSSQLTIEDIDNSLSSGGYTTIELVYEIPSLIVERTLFPEDVWAWFTDLDPIYQTLVVQCILYSSALCLTQNAVAASFAGFLAPVLRKCLIESRD